MAAPAEHVRVKVFVSYGQYYISSPNVGGDAVPGPDQAANHLIAVAPDGACLLSGTHTGDIWLQLETWDGPPPLDLGAWEEVVEATFTSTTDHAFITEWGEAPREDLPNVATTGPGTYRLRLSARGRKEGLDAGDLDEDDEPVEEHRLQTWPSPPIPDHSLKTTEHVAANWPA